MLGQKFHALSDFSYDSDSGIQIRIKSSDPKRIPTGKMTLKISGSVTTCNPYPDIKPFIRIFFRFQIQIRTRANIPPVRPPHSHSPSGRVPASSGEWFRPLPALGHQQFSEPSHKHTMHRHQPTSQTNPPARRDRDHHHRPQQSKCHPQNSNT